MRTTTRGWLVMALALGGCLACDDLAQRERNLVRAAASCEVDADCRVVPAEGCHLICAVAIATAADQAAVASQLRGVRADTEALGCSCPVADCVAIADLSASCVAGVCRIR